MTYHCPRDSTFPWQPYFDRHVFRQNFNFSYFKIKQKLSCSIFKAFRSFYVVFIHFSYFWPDFGQRFELLDLSRNPRWRFIRKWLRNYYAMWRHHLMLRTSKEIFQTYYLRSKSRCHRRNRPQTSPHPIIYTSFCKAHHRLSTIKGPRWRYEFACTTEGYFIKLLLKQVPHLLEQSGHGSLGS